MKITVFDNSIIEMIGSQTNFVLKTNCTYIGKGKSIIEKAQNLQNLSIISTTLEIIRPKCFYFSNLVEVDFSECENLIIFDEACFQGSINLKRVICPNSLKVINPLSFFNCNSLEEIQISQISQLKFIGESSFFGTALKSFYIPQNLRTIAGNAFCRVTTIKHIKISKENHYFNYVKGCLINNKNKYLFFYKNIKKTKDKLEIPDCKQIDSYSFLDCSITTVILPISLQIIHDHAFYHSHIENIDFTLCQDSLKTIDLELCTYLEFIGNSAFYNCFSLYSIKLPDSLLNISENAFHSCIKLKEVYITQNSLLNSIGNYSFYNTSISSFYIGQFVNDIGTKAFTLTNLTELTVDSRNEYFVYSNNALIQSKNKIFYLYVHNTDTKMKKYYIEDGIEVIRTAAFHYITNIKKIIIPHSVKIIMEEAICFTSIKKLIVPKETEILEKYCFADNYYLEELEFQAENDLQIPEYLCKNCISLISIRILGNITIIKNNAFIGCPMIQCVYAPFVSKYLLHKHWPERVFSNDACSISNHWIKIY